MIDGKRAIAVIPARAGSKVLPDKNLRPLGGKPLLAWPIVTAKATPEIDRIIVSTDGIKIADAAREYGAEVYNRPAELAGDPSLVIDAIRDLINRLHKEGETAEYMVLLEATSPFRRPDDIRACLRLLEEKNYDSAATFTEAALNPHRAFKIVATKPITFIDGAVPWLPRQKLPRAWQLNGMVYAFRIDRLDETSPALLFGSCGATEISRDRSIDIDDEKDFLVAEAMLDKFGDNYFT